MDEVKRFRNEIQTIFIVMIVLASVLILVLYSTIAKSNQVINNNPINQAPVVNTNFPVTFNNNSVIVTANYINDEVVYSGQVAKPTPCQQVTHEAVVLESYPEQVQLKINIAAPAKGTVCAQMISYEEISGHVKVSNSAQFTVFLNDQPVTTSK